MVNIKFEKVHIWDLPINKIYIKLGDIRKDLINISIEKSNNIIEGKTRRKADKLVTMLNKNSNGYNIKKLKSSRIVFHWRRGNCFIPLWAIL